MKSGHYADEFRPACTYRLVSRQSVGIRCYIGKFFGRSIRGLWASQPEKVRLQVNLKHSREGVSFTLAARKTRKSTRKSGLLSDFAPSAFGFLLDSALAFLR